MTTVPDAYRDEWIRVFGQRPEFAIPQSLAETGWPVTVVEEFGALADKVMRTGTWLGKAARGIVSGRGAERLNQITRQEIAARTAFLAVALHGSGARAWPDARNWVTVLAGVPDEDTWLAAWDLTEPLERTGWFGGVPSPVAALSFVAGLSAAEMGTQHAEGTLDLEVLRALAALRGWMDLSPSVEGDPVAPEPSSH